MPVGSVRGSRIVQGHGPGIYLDRDQVYYRNKYVGWCSHGICQPMIFDKEVAPVLVEEILDALMARDQAYRIPPLRRKPYFTATSGHY